jgi:hypothetical protein
MNKKVEYAVQPKLMPQEYQGPEVFKVAGPGVGQYMLNNWTKQQAEEIVRMLYGAHEAGRKSMGQDIRMLIGAKAWER